MARMQAGKIKFVFEILSFFHLGSVVFVFFYLSPRIYYTGVITDV